jgi:chromosome segregation protein
MKLLRLELFGFKSFLNRTVFQFSEGITSIVGPNGCGKSNIVDAVIWALGERGTKSLRVKDMGDVIFHGSNGKRPVNIAEVAVELSDGEKDLTIKRRIYRDGSNEYYMNGNPVRLKDIQDFFLGTGIGLNTYAIVEQGRIEYFVQMKPQERRVVIEETSGVTRFEEKKRDALIRMEEVTTNLERIEDIYSEVIKNFEKAENEWNRWKEYKLLTDKLSEIDTQILIDGYMKLTRKIGKIKEKHEDLDREIEGKEEEKNRLKEEFATKEDEFLLVDNTIRELEVDIKGKEKDMESRLLEIEYIRDEKKRLEEEKETLIKDKIELEGQIKKVGEGIEALKIRQEEHALLLKGEEEQGNGLRETVERLKGETEEYEKRIEEERVRLFVTMSNITDIKNRIAQLERLGRERQQREEKKRSEQEGMKERLSHLEAKHGALIETLEKERLEKEGIVSKEVETLKQRETLLKAINEKKNIVERLKGEKQGREEFLKQISEQKENKIEGPVDTKRLIDMLRVDEDKEKVLERFFFKEMEYSVLSQNDLKAISEMVKKYDGNYIFFPKKGIFKLNEQQVEIDLKWTQGIEEALARIENGEEGIFIGNNVYIDSRGFILGGKETETAGLKRFKEQIRVEKELKEMEGILQEHLTSIKDAQNQHNDLDRIYREVKEKNNEKEKSINRIEKEVIISETELRTIRERLNELVSKVDFFEETSETTIGDLLKERELHDREKEGTEEKMASLRGELDNIKRTYDDTLSRWHEITISLERKRNLLNTLYEDTERNLTLIKTLTDEKQRKQEKIEQTEKGLIECLKKIGGLEKGYETLQKTCERQIERYEELKKTSGNLHMEKHALQEKIDMVNKDADKIKGKRENIETDIAVLIEKKDMIYERLKTAYGIEEPENITIQYSKNLEVEREDIAKEISDIGEVNFRAEKEYLELKERVAFLDKQKEDLKNAMESLKKTITKIDSLSREIFFETFEVINDTFKRFTHMLFRGGNGYLVFNQDVSGIEMYVQPPGKKVVRMEQLSGGEKALVSLAFLLSLMDTKPSPFSFLDEIDAPLDDANIMSLLEIIKSISNKTQIVFITHNRITMESSNTIYGVTMEEEGISKVVSVRL